MSNEEMVIRIQQGEREQFRALWAQVERYVYMRARWRALVEPENGGFEELPEDMPTPFDSALPSDISKVV